jgi:prevent-host-death family protein
MRTWQLRTAKSRFSEVLDLAVKEGPQLVTRRGEEVVVVLSAWATVMVLLATISWTASTCRAAFMLRRIRVTSGVAFFAYYRVFAQQFTPEGLVFPFLVVQRRLVSNQLSKHLSNAWGW